MDAANNNNHSANSTTQNQTDTLNALNDSPAARLDADMYTAEDIDGVTEGLFGSGNLNYLVLQSQQTNEAQQNADPFAVAGAENEISAPGENASASNIQESGGNRSDADSSLNRIDGGSGQSGNRGDSFADGNDGGDISGKGPVNNITPIEASAAHASGGSGGGGRRGEASDGSDGNDGDGNNGSPVTAQDGKDGSSGTDGTNGTNGTNGTDAGDPIQNIVNNTFNEVTEITDILNQVVNNTFNDITNIINNILENPHEDPDDTDLTVDIVSGLLNGSYDINLDLVEAIVGDIDIDIDAVLDNLLNGGLLGESGLNADVVFNTLELLGLDTRDLTDPLNMHLVNIQNQVIGLATPLVESVIGALPGPVQDILTYTHDFVTGLLDGNNGGDPDIEISLLSDLGGLGGGFSTLEIPLDPLEALVGDIDISLDNILTADLADIAGILNGDLPVLGSELDITGDILPDINITTATDDIIGSVEDLLQTAGDADIPGILEQLVENLHDTFDTLATDIPDTVGGILEDLGSDTPVQDVVDTVADLVNDLTGGLLDSSSADNGDSDLVVDTGIDILDTVIDNLDIDVELDLVEEIVGDIDININLDALLSSDLSGLDLTAGLDADLDLLSGLNEGDPLSIEAGLGEIIDQVWPEASFTDGLDVIGDILGGGINLPDPGGIVADGIGGLLGGDTGGGGGGGGLLGGLGGGWGGGGGGGGLGLGW